MVKLITTISFRFLNYNGMGHWWIEVQMEKANETFDSTKEKYNHLFKAVALLINFLHRCRQDFTFEVIGEHHNDPTKHG
jgi:hypothetical protein